MKNYCYGYFYVFRGNILYAYSNGIKKQQADTNYFSPALLNEK